MAPAFLDANRGWAIGEAGLIVETSNGGATWTTQSSGTSRDLHAITTFGLQAALVAGELGGVLETSDGGTTWNGRGSVTKNDFRGVRFIDAISTLSTARPDSR
jgi:photosystem II stability/assembly factor-like uncharacterized protein